jgi:hypothetical protein
VESRPCKVDWEVALQVLLEAALTENGKQAVLATTSLKFRTNIWTDTTAKRDEIRSMEMITETASLEGMSSQDSLSPSMIRTLYYYEQGGQ